jgi:asparagine synthetase B (glutamine-hydrolysing)
VVTARDALAFGQLDASLCLLFQAIRRESTVALSGESADELFAAMHPDLVRTLDVPAMSQISTRPPLQK